MLGWTILAIHRWARACCCISKPVHDAVSSVQSTYQCSTDEALAKRIYGHLRTPRLAIVRHCFVFARQHREVGLSRAFASKGLQLCAVAKQNLAISPRANYHPASVPARKRQRIETDDLLRKVSLSRKQVDSASLRTWELRAAMNLARFWRDQGKPQQARDCLIFRPCFPRTIHSRVHSNRLDKSSSTPGAGTS